jgi:uncharacterized protein YyaL (SSP411 family)
MRRLTAAAFAEYRPDLVIAARAVGAETEIPLLEGRDLVAAGDAPQATAWLCRRFACLAPTTDPDVLQRLLSSGA